GRLIQIQLRIAIEFMPDGGLGFLLQQRPALNQPAFEQLAPLKRFVDIHLRGGQWAAGEVFQQLACDRQCRQQNRLVENDHRHRGLADVINARDRFALGGALPSTNDDRLADGLLAVLVDEVQQRSLAQTVQKYRLVMLKYLDSRQHTLRVHADQQPYWLAGKPLQVRVVIGLEGITDQFVQLEHAINRRLLQLRLDPRSLGEQLHDPRIHFLGV